MKLNAGASILNSALFRSFTIYRDALIMQGKQSRLIRGQNAHLLLPFVFFDEFPTDILLSSHEPKLFGNCGASMHVRGDDVDEVPDRFIHDLTPLGRPLTFTAPRRDIGGQWFSLEAYNWAAVHRQSDFMFLTLSSQWEQFHLKFATQAYALDYDPAGFDRLWEELQTLFPADLTGPNQDGEKHGFTVYSASNDFAAPDHATTRFPRFTGMRRIKDDEIDTSEFGAIPPRLRKITLNGWQLHLQQNAPQKRRGITR